MKFLPVLLPFFLVSQLYGQVNRAYFNVNAGIRNCLEYGVVVHGFNYFSAAFYSDYRRIPTAPNGYPKNNYKGTSLKDVYSIQTIFVGVTSKRLKQPNFSLLVGPSWITAKEAKSFTIHTNDISHMQWLTAEWTSKSSIGLAVRSDIVIRLNRIIGIDLAIQANFNRVKTDGIFLFGVCFGLVDDLSDPVWSRDDRE